LLINNGEEAIKQYINIWLLLISDFVHVFGIFIDENSIFIDEKSIFINENDIILTADYVRHAAGRLLDRLTY